MQNLAVHLPTWVNLCQKLIQITKYVYLHLHWLVVILIKQRVNYYFGPRGLAKIVVLVQ